MKIFGINFGKKIKKKGKKPQDDFVYLPLLRKSGKIVPEISGEDKDLVLCPNCGGLGFISFDHPQFLTPDDYLDPDICLLCNGLGTVSRDTAERFDTGNY